MSLQIYLTCVQEDRMEDGLSVENIYLPSKVQEYTNYMDSSVGGSGEDEKGATAIFNTLLRKEMVALKKALVKAIVEDCNHTYRDAQAYFDALNDS